MKTSADSPIRVDFITHDALGSAVTGRLGLTIAPGKHDAGAGWQRDLDTDLIRLREGYGAATLVSLMEDHEYELLKIGELRKRATAVGLEVLWFPIRDVDVPRDDEMKAFAALIDDILQRTLFGQTVVIHCRGGLGRSGLVAAAYLVALGHSPDAALGLVRDARPGAVETRAQERWVMRYAEEPR